MNEEKATREEVIQFLLKEQRSPSTKIEGEKRIKKAFHRFVYDKKDEEIIALKNKFADNTKRHKRLMMSATMTGETVEERVARIRRQHEETGLWPAVDSTDYNWITNNYLELEEIKKLREEMRQKPVIPKKSVAPAELDARKISDLTLSEISELLKIIGNKTISELIAEPEKPKEPEKVDISKIETTLSEDTIRTIINPEKEVIVTNPKWEKAKDVLEYLFADDSLKRHFAYEMLLESPVFAQEVAKLVRDNPKKTFYHKDKIVERMINSIPADRYYLLNPANIQDLVANCF